MRCHSDNPPRLPRVPHAGGGHTGSRVATDPLDGSVEHGGLWSEALGEIRQRSRAVAQGTGDPGGAGDVRGRHVLADGLGLDRLGDRDRVELHRAGHGLVAAQHVVVDLHDDHRAGGDQRSCPLRVHVLAVTRRPGGEPGRLSDLTEVRAGQGSLTEAGPALAVGVRLLGGRHELGRDEEQDRVVHLGAVREELRGDDVGVLLHVGVHQRAVVVVRPSVGSRGGVRLGLLEAERRHLRRRRGTRLRSDHRQRRQESGCTEGDCGETARA